MKTLLTSLVASMLALTCLGQIKLVERKEYPSKDFDDLIVTDLSNNRLLVYTKEEVKRNTYAYNYELLDEKLNVLTNRTLTYPTGFNSFITDVSEHHSAMIRFNSKKGIGRFYSINLRTLETSEFDITLPKKGSFERIALFGNYCVTEVNSGKKKVPSFIRIFDLEKKAFKDVQYNADTKYIFNICTVDEDEQMELHITYKLRGEETYEIERFDRKNKKIGQTLRVEVPDKFLTAFSVTKSADNNYFLVSGSYSHDNDDTPSGVFFAKISMLGKIRFAKYKEYDEIQNFFSYLPERKQEKIERKKQRAEKKGKELEFEYRAATHDVHEHNGDYYYIAEFYYPTYRQDCHYTYDANGHATSHCVTVFDGYQYTHSVVSCFSEEGEALWSNTLAMEKSYKPYSVQRFIEPVFNTSGSVNLLYTNNNYIHSTTLSKGKVVEDLKYSEIETDSSADNVKRVSKSSSMNLWHDNFVYLYGWQKIKDGETGKTRKVFYVNIAQYQ